MYATSTGRVTCKRNTHMQSRISQFLKKAFIRTIGLGSAIVFSRESVIHSTKGKITEIWANKFTLIQK